MRPHLQSCPRLALGRYGAEPSRLSDGQASSGVVIGDLGGRATEVPSTFRESPGAVEGEDAIPQSHGALLVGILAAALVAAAWRRSWSCVRDRAASPQLCSKP